MPTFDSLKVQNATLIRKALEGAVFIAPYSTAAITVLTDASSALLAVPAGYTDVGMLTKDGASFPVESNSTDSTAWGYAQPVRKDITSKEFSVSFTMKETKKLTLELHTGLNLTGVLATLASGEFKFSHPDRPDTIYYRAFVLARDGEGTGEHFVAKFMPRVSVTDVGEETWNEDTDMERQITLTSYLDPVLGTALTEFRGGLGWKAGLTAAGIASTAI